jgi:hypothetical protein
MFSITDNISVLGLRKLLALSEVDVRHSRSRSSTEERSLRDLQEGKGCVKPSRHETISENTCDLLQLPRARQANAA